MGIGHDTRTGVYERDYQVAFRFIGTSNKITSKPGPPRMTEEQIMRVAKMGARGRD